MFFGVHNEHVLSRRKSYPSCIHPFRFMRFILFLFQFPLSPTLRLPSVCRSFGQVINPNKFIGTTSAFLCLSAWISRNRIFPTRPRYAESKTTRAHVDRTASRIRGMHVPLVPLNFKHRLVWTEYPAHQQRLPIQMFFRFVLFCHESGVEIVMLVSAENR